MEQVEKIYNWIDKNIGKVSVNGSNHMISGVSIYGNSNGEGCLRCSNEDEFFVFDEKFIKSVTFSEDELTMTVSDNRKDTVFSVVREKKNENSLPTVKIEGNKTIEKFIKENESKRLYYIDELDNLEECAYHVCEVESHEREFSDDAIRYIKFTDDELTDVVQVKDYLCGCDDENSNRFIIFPIENHSVDEMKKLLENKAKFDKLFTKSEESLRDVIAKKVFGDKKTPSDTKKSPFEQISDMMKNAPIESIHFYKENGEVRVTLTHNY